MVPPFVFSTRDADESLFRELDELFDVVDGVGVENIDDILECLDSIGSIVSKPIAAKSGSFFALDDDDADVVVYIALL